MCLFWVYSPLGSTYKALFQGTQIEEILLSMTTVKTVPEGCKTVECECGMGGKNYPICFIPEQDLIQDALKTKTKTTHFKLMLPEGGIEMRMAIWVSGTLKHILTQTDGFWCKVPGSRWRDQVDEVKNLKMDLDIAKDVHSEAKKDHRKKKDMTALKQLS